MLKKATKIYLKKPKKDDEYGSLRPRIYGGEKDHDDAPNCCRSFIEDFLNCQPGAFCIYIVFGIIFLLVFFILIGMKFSPLTLPSKRPSWIMTLVFPAIWWIMVAMHVNCLSCYELCNSSKRCCLRFTLILIVRALFFSIGVGCCLLANMLDGKSIATFMSDYLFALIVVTLAGIFVGFIPNFGIVFKE